ncbi:sphingomyelin phosphodiesterase-like [Glandiceps talaboti]
MVAVRECTFLLVCLVANFAFFSCYPLHSSDTESAHMKKLREISYQKWSKFESSRQTSARVKGIIGSLECSLCKFGIGLLQRLMLMNATVEEIVTIATDVCVFAKYETERICQYIVPEFKDEVLYVVDKLVLSPEEACGVLFGSSCGHPFDPHFFWNLTLPDIPKPPVNPPKPPKAGSPVSRVLQLSDLHYDRQYKVGAKADCGEPLCCRDNDGSPGPSSQGAGKYGDYRNCDSPKILLENLFDHISSEEKFDYIFLTGDLPAHDVWNQSRSDQLEILDEITEMFSKYFPGVKVYPAVGNHESAPVNSFPPEYITGKYSISWLYDGFVDQWVNKTGWLPDSTIDTLKKGGYYTVLLAPHFRLVSLNMQMCNDQNYWLLLNATDPTGELKWLIDVLQAAEINEEKVHIIGHNHPSSCMKAWGWNYYRIVDRYESTILGQFFGHSHDDFFEMFYDEKTLSRPTSVAYVSGSVTPFQSLNPSYRIYDVDGNYTKSTRAILDHHNYVLNLTDANLTNKPKWFHEYSAKSAYNMKALQPSDWQKVIENLKTNDTMFNNFSSYNKKLHVTSPCTGACKEAMICELETARTDDPDLCKDKFYTKLTQKYQSDFRSINKKC